MPGHKFLKTGLRGFMPVMAHDEWQAPPPIPIVRDEVGMVRALQAEFAAVQRQEMTCCIVIAKPYSASRSPEADVLEAVGERFARNLRPYDGLFVFGSDRYLISLPHIAPEDTVTVMKRLRTQVTQDRFAVDGGKTVMVTATFGGTMLDPGALLHEHIERAHEAHNWAVKGMNDGMCMWEPQS